MISSSLSSVTILENAAENAIPISIKFKTGFGITRSLNINPTPDAIRIFSIRSKSVPLELLSFFRNKPANSPAAAPITKGSITTRAIIYAGSSPAERFPATFATVVKKTMQPTISSSAAMGIRVFVTGPSALNSRTIDNAGAGAVARAMPPNKKARYSGIS